MANESHGSLMQSIYKLLMTEDVDEKVDGIEKLVSRWQAGEIQLIQNEGDIPSPLPDCWPAPKGVELVEPRKLKQGSKKALIHSLVHAEFNACSLMLDIILRFYSEKQLGSAFIDDFLKVASEEVKHFRSWRERLRQLTDQKEDYGSMCVHNSLWDSAQDTIDSLEARLCIVHGVHEARGLDVSETLRMKLEKSNDAQSLSILNTNVADECGHVRIALKWLIRINNDDEARAKGVFQDMVVARFNGKLKPPFNHELREKAGFPSRAWYEEVSSDAA